MNKWPQAALCKLQFQKSATRRQHFPPPHSGYCFNYSLREKFSGWKFEWNVLVQRPNDLILITSPLLPLTAQINTNVCQNWILRVIGMRDERLKKKVRTQPLEPVETRGQFKALSTQRVHHPLDTLGFVRCKKAQLYPSSCCHPESGAVRVGGGFICEHL